MGKRFSGKTDDASAPILGAKFWTKGFKIVGRVLRAFDTANGTCYQLELDKPLKVDGAKVSPEQKGIVEGHHFSIGAMTGFQMALDASGAGALQPGDRIEITCIGTTATDKGNPRVDFSVDVER